MRVALVAPPFLPVPPKKYGGTELFIAQLAEGLKNSGIDVVVYTNGESTVGVEKRWLYETQQWPIKGEVFDNLQDFNHASWAIADAAPDCDVIHLNNVPALMFTRYVPDRKFVYTVHHVHEEQMSEVYDFFPKVEFVTISDFQRKRESMARMRTIHHGIDLNAYKLRPKKQDYLCFLGQHCAHQGHSPCHRGRQKERHSPEDCRRSPAHLPRLFRYADQAARRRQVHRISRRSRSGGKKRAAGKFAGHAVSDSVERAVRPGDDRSHGVWNAGPGAARAGPSKKWCATEYRDTSATRWRRWCNERCHIPGTSIPHTCGAICKQYFSVERMVDEYVALYQESGRRGEPAGQVCLPNCTMARKNGWPGKHEHARDDSL